MMGGLRLFSLLLVLATALPLGLAGTEAAAGAEAAQAAAAAEADEAAEVAAGAPGTWLARAQSALTSSVTDSFRELDRSPSVGRWLLLAAFSVLLGAAHAVLPGRRKGVLVSYFLAEDTPLPRGIVAAAAVAVLQVLSAVLLVLAGSRITGRRLSHVFEHGAAWMQGLTGVLMVALGLILLVLRILEFVRTRDDWREDKFISKLHTVDSRIDPNNEDPAVQLMVSHARKLRRRRRGNAPWLPVLIVSGAVPSPTVALLLLSAISAGTLAAGVLALVGVTLGLAGMFVLCAAAVIVAKERGIDMLGGRAAHYTHLGVEIAAALGLALLGAIALSAL